MKEIATGRGILKYRMPNIPEAFIVLEKSGISSGETSTLLLKGNIINSMEKFVDFSAIEGVTKYEELLNDVDNMIIPLGEIADEIILKTFAVFKKKN